MHQDKTKQIYDKKLNEFLKTLNNKDFASNIVEHATFTEQVKRVIRRIHKK